MNIRGTRVAVALLVALLTVSSLMVPATAAPEMAPGTLLQPSKQEKKQAADQAKAEAKAEKERKKYVANYGEPRITLTSVDCTVEVLVENLVPGFSGGYNIRFFVQGPGQNQNEFVVAETPWRDSSRYVAQTAAVPGATLTLDVLTGGVLLASSAFTCNL